MFVWKVILWDLVALHVADSEALFEALNAIEIVILPQIRFLKSNDFIFLITLDWFFK